MCEDAEKKIEEAKDNAESAWEHKEEADEYLEKIRKIIENYEAGNADEASKSAADECERLKSDIVKNAKSIADILVMLKDKMNSISELVMNAAEEMKKAMEARDIALEKLDEAKSKVNLTTHGEGDGETDDLAELK